MKDKRIGLKPKDRKLATPKPNKKLTANQWVASPLQDKFMALYMSPTIDGKVNQYFGKAYDSAIEAGYKPSYAHKITSPSTLNGWIGLYRKQIELTPKHISAGLADMYINPRSYSDSRSPADTRLKSLEIAGKFLGLGDSKGVTVNIVQPILGGESVKRTVIDQ